MTLFKPGMPVVYKIVAASPAFAGEMQARALTKQPEKEAMVDGEQARAVLGEQIIGRIVMLARNTACRQPGSRIVFLDSSGTINPDWDRSFFTYLRLPRKTQTAHEIRRLLAEDLTSWTIKHARDAEEIGMSADGKGRLHLLCRPLKAVLDPVADS